MIEFSEYAVRYSKYAVAQRNDLESPLRMTLEEIIDELAENPDKYPLRTISLTDDIFIYRHPQPQLEITFKLDRERKVIFILHLVAPKREVTKSVFISYSHKDLEWLFELKKWLIPLEQKDLIEIWDDTKIKVGNNWREKIENSLQSAKVAVLLVSQDFLLSKYISEYVLPVLLGRSVSEGLKIYWIAVKESTIKDSHPEIAQFLPLNKVPLISLDPAGREKEFRNIYKMIKEALEE